MELRQLPNHHPGLVLRDEKGDRVSALVLPAWRAPNLMEKQGVTTVLNRPVSKVECYQNLLFSSLNQDCELPVNDDYD